MDNPYAIPSPGSEFEHLDALAEERGPCMVCGDPEGREVSFMWVMSFLIFTRHSEYSGRLCRRCSTGQAARDLGKSALLGWWGIPWGLLTFKALWVNTKTLVRWSTLPPLLAGALGVAGLAPIAGIAGWLVYSDIEEGRAREAGNWVDDTVVALVEEGHRAYDEGDLELALGKYRQAHRQAPGSSVINLSLARVYSDLDVEGAALHYAARAQEIDSQSVDATVLHGQLLARAERLEEARAEAQKVVGAEPENEYAAVDLADLFAEVSDAEEQLRVARWGLERAPDLLPLQYHVLDALLELDRPEEYLDERDRVLGAEVREQPVFAFIDDLYGMRVAPLVRLEEVLHTWAAQGYAPQGMERLVQATERSGALDAVRSKVHSWLMDPDTPGDTWAAAKPWFTDEAWPGALDRRLAAGVEATPAMMRVATLRKVTGLDRRLELLQQVADLDHPWARVAGVSYFGNLAGFVPMDDFGRRLDSHATLHPDDPWCRLSLAMHLGLRDLEAAEAVLSGLEQGPEDEPFWSAAAIFGRTILAVAGNQMQRARSLLEEIPADALAPLVTREDIMALAAEIAFVSGDQAELAVLQRELEHARRRSIRVAMLMYRWGDQLASGTTVTFDRDVAAWLDGEQLEDLKHEASTAVQSLLLVQGLVDEQWLRVAAGDWFPETRELLAIFKAVGGGVSPDLDALRRIADSDPPYSLGPIVARTMLRRMGGLRSAGTARPKPPPPG